VPSLETCSVATCGRSSVKAWASSDRSPRPMLVISSNEVAPRSEIQCQS
jgi:hypothetical protein